MAWILAPKRLMEAMMPLSALPPGVLAGRLTGPPMLAMLLQPALG
jgi:hypothetical protein